MRVLQTERLVLSHFSAEDASFVLALVNDPDWIRFIGDRKVRTVGDALEYLASGPIAMYAREGFGLYRTALAQSDQPIGMCGLIRRPGLADVDLGFAFLPAYRGRGYAYESASGVIDHARTLGFARIVAIASPDNVRSARLLRRLGFDAPTRFRLPGGSEDLDLFARTLAARSASP
jgi:RimJ/RimL family protein N-acetyltransferase